VGKRKRTVEISRYSWDEMAGMGGKVRYVFTSLRKKTKKERGV